MKNLHRNPIFYYIAIPLLVGVWPLTMAFKYLPQMKNDLADQKEYYVESEVLMGEILALDPDRLSYTDANRGDVTFSYGAVIDNVASSYGIRDYSVNEQLATKEGQKATVKIEDINIQQCAKFLATLQMRWDKLTCNTFSLTRKREMKDQWTMTLTLAYAE